MRKNHKTDRKENPVESIDSKQYTHMGREEQTGNEFPHTHIQGPSLHHRNFWSEWRQERHHHHGYGTGMQYRPELSLKEIEAWREFFFQRFGTVPEEHWIIGGRRFSPWHQGMDTFNPFIATLLSKGGGLLPLYVLHLISLKPRYGNEIMDLLAERTNGQWVSNPGAIYPLLALLEKESFIEGKWEDPDKRTVRIYTITDKGKSEVSQIDMIVLPKLKETISVLRSLTNDLQPNSFEETDVTSPSSEEEGSI